VDDIKEAGSAILGCFCCFMCAGPVLVVVGVAFLVSSLTDTRGIKIEQYENQLSFYNTKGWSFEGQDLWVQAHASTNAGVMTGSNGWQDVGKMAQWDAAKSNAENKVRDSLYSSPPLEKGTAYEWSAAGSAPLSSNLTQHDQNSNQFFKLRVRNAANDVVSESDVLRAKVDNRFFLDYTPSQNKATGGGIQCYAQQYSSSYQSKHRAEIKRKYPTCEAYCAERSGQFQWRGTEQASDRAQCTQTLGLKRVAWRLCLGGLTTIESCPCTGTKCAVTTAEKALPPYECTAGTCKAGADSEVLTDGKFGTAESYNFVEKTWSNTSGIERPVGDFHVAQYGLVRQADRGLFEGSGLDGQHLKKLEVRVRWQQDPYILASALTGGCSSGAGDSFLYWNPSTATTGKVSGSDNSGTGQCFGLTVEQKRQIGIACLVVGILCLLPVYCLVKWARGRKAKSAPPPPAGAGAGAGVMPVPQKVQYPAQYPAQQMVAQQPVMVGQPQPQYVMAGQPMQQVQQVQQPGQQVVMMQAVQPGQQPVMVAQPVYAQQQVAMPNAPNYTA